MHSAHAYTIYIPHIQTYAHRFTGGERKICKNIKKSQNIMKMIVVPQNHPCPEKLLVANLHLLQHSTVFFCKMLHLKCLTKF